MRILAILILIFLGIIFSFESYFLQHIASIERLLGWHLTNQALHLHKLLWITSGISAVTMYVIALVLDKK